MPAYDRATALLDGPDSEAQPQPGPSKQGLSEQRCFNCGSYTHNLQVQPFARGTGGAGCTVQLMHGSIMLVEMLTRHDAQLAPLTGYVERSLLTSCRKRFSRAAPVVMEAEGWVPIACMALNRTHRHAPISPRRW